MIREKLKNIIRVFFTVFLILLFSTVFSESEYLTAYIERYKLNPSLIKSFVQEVVVLETLEGQIVEIDSVPMGLSEAVYFNRDGYLSARIFYDNGPNGQIYWERFYDSRCNKESFFYRYDRRNAYALNAYIEYEYDSECHIMREIHFNYDEVTYVPHPMQTNEDGNIIPFQRYYSNGLRSETVFNRFNETLEQYSYDENGTITYYNSKPYRFVKPAQNETAVIALPEEGVIEADGTITYWANDKLLKREILDLEGNIIEEKWYSLKNTTIFTINKYHSQGHLQERNTFDENGDLKSSEKCQYEYDDFENWVSKTCTNYSLNNGELESGMPYRLLRRIEYYSN